MFEALRCAWRAVVGRHFDAALSSGPRPSDQACFTCGAFSYCDADDVDGCDGYCCHPDHLDPSKSPHHEYGGHWTSHDSWCRWWIPGEVQEMAERRTRRAVALRKAVDAVDPAATNQHEPSTREEKH